MCISAEEIDTDISIHIYIYICNFIYIYIISYYIIKNEVWVFLHQSGSFFTLSTNHSPHFGCGECPRQLHGHGRLGCIGARQLVRTATWRGVIFPLKMAIDSGFSYHQLPFYPGPLRPGGLGTLDLMLRGWIFPLKMVVFHIVMLTNLSGWWLSPTPLC